MLLQVEEKYAPEKYAISSLALDIGDVNDTPPQFTQSEYWVTIAEHSMEGTLIVETKATDADMVGMPNVTFSFFVIY